MVQYSSIRFWKDKTERDRTLDRLLALRSGIAEQISPNSKLSSFHLATWNIRDLGSTKFNPRARLPESLFYIAEMISAFDLVAIQEVNDHLTEFESIMKLLGPHWTYIVTDASGNQERLAFAYDTRKILFRRIAGEIVLPKTKAGNPIQFNRTPFLVAFQAGWFKFNICTVHILFGDDDDLTGRINEIEAISKFFEKRQEKDGESYILLGDFNILNPKDATMKALKSGGFTIPDNLMIPSNLRGGKYYDQIAFRGAKKEAEIVDANVFKWQDYVFRDGNDFESYKPYMEKDIATGKKLKLTPAGFKSWRTWQISDHLPMWAEIKIDFTDDYLKSLSGSKPLANMKKARKEDV